jgi:hypothetical protein
MKGICILPVNRIMKVLKLKKVQCHPVEVVKGSVEDLIFPIRYFRRIIQLIIIKFEIQNTKMRNTVLFSIIILSLFSCKKDKYTTTPQLKYKSVNTKQLQRGGTLKFTLSFTDAEGDLTDSLWVQKIVRACPDKSNSSFTQLYKIPAFPTSKNQSGEIIVAYEYIQINPICPSRNDTAVFRFVLKDKAKNKSDTVVSDQVIINY